jgi:phage-related protein
LRVRLVASGVWTLYGVADGQHDVLLELDNLREARESDVDAMIRLLEEIAAGDRDPTRLSDRVSHRVDDDHQIWEFVRGRIRLLWFYQQNRVIVCGYAFLKQSQKTPKSAIQIAIQLRQKYEVESVEIIEDEDG